MGRVRDDDVGGRDVGDHAVSGLRELAPADGASHLGREVALARLLLDLLLGHLHRLLVAAPLPGEVDRGEQHERPADVERQRQHGPGELTQHRAGRAPVRAARRGRRGQMARNAATATTPAFARALPDSKSSCGAGEALEPGARVDA